MNNTIEKQDILFQDFTNLKITQETKEHVIKHQNYAFDTRTRLGKFYTDEEKHQYLEESLKRPLPGEEGPTLSKRKIPKK